MEMMLTRVFGAVAIVSLLLAAIAFPAAMANSPAPAPAPGPALPPTSDGTTIDQGVAIVLMVVALALTYLIH